MAKYKTPKTIRKRFRITKKKRYIARKAGQGHFNSRESGVITSRKRRDRKPSKVHSLALKQIIPV